MKNIHLQINNYCLNAVLLDTPAGEALWHSLPIHSKGNLWGEEIYFPIQAKVKLDNGQEVVEEGDLGFWPPGSAFCIFYGLTPMSSNGEIRPASAVEVVGKIIDDFSCLKKIKSSPTIRIEKGAKCNDKIS